MKKIANKAVKSIKTIRGNMVAPTPRKAAIGRNYSLVAVLIGLGVKLLAAFKPEWLPDAVLSVNNEIFYIGLSGLGLAGFLQNKRIK